MVTDHVIGASDVGKTFAESVKDDPDVVGIWARRHREVFEIWLLTEPIDREHERALYAEVGSVHDAFPYALIRVHLLNPVNVEGEDQETLMAEEIPGNAELIFPRRE